MSPTVRAERTGWRDKDLSARHRVWGWDCPAVDLDFLLVEYNIGKPVALVEYKHWRASRVNLRHPTYRALTELADMADLPFVVARYWPGVWAFRVWPINAVAAQSFENAENMTEREYVMRMYRLRRLVLSREISAHLMDERPPLEGGRDA